MSLVKRLTDDDRKPNVERIEKIRKAVRSPKKNSWVRVAESKIKEKMS